MIPNVARWVLVPIASLASCSATAVVADALGGGARLAWLGLRHWHFPELHPRAYQASTTPLLLSLTGGLFGVLAVLVHHRTRTRTTRVVKAAP